jgi:hypothetical protein
VGLGQIVRCLANTVVLVFCIRFKLACLNRRNPADREQVSMQKASLLYGGQVLGYLLRASDFGFWTPN